MIYYFIDHENAKNQGLVGINLASKDDVIYLFYTDRSNTLSIDFIEASKELNVSYIKVPTGPESLDKHLIGHVGYILNKLNDNDKIVIVALDKGYDPICEYFNKLVNRSDVVIKVSSFKVYLESKVGEMVKEDSNNESLEELKELLKGYPVHSIKVALSIYQKYSTNKNATLSMKYALKRRKNISSKDKDTISNILKSYYNKIHNKE